MKSALPRILKTTLLALLAVALGSTAAQAQATRTWVSGVGDDANPCSRTAPCKTFAGAISKTATGGEINAIDPGGFGAVTITKSITIDGGGTFASVLASGTNGIIINSATAVVNLRNLSINGAGTGLNGIRILSAAKVNIENSVIDGFTQKGVDIAPTGACKVNLKDMIIRNCAQGAVRATPGASGVAVNISRSSLSASQFGFRADDFTNAALDDCVMAGNMFNGVLAFSGASASSVSVNGCVMNDNAASGVVATGGLATARISNCTIFGNATGIQAQSGAALISFGNNRIQGNTSNGVPTSTIGQQ